MHKHSMYLVHVCKMSIRPVYSMADRFMTCMYSHKTHLHTKLHYNTSEWVSLHMQQYYFSLVGLVTYTITMGCTNNKPQPLKVYSVNLHAVVHQQSVRAACGHLHISLT